MRTAFSTNLIVLQGNVTRDPEVKVTKNGTFVMKFGLATEHSKGAENDFEKVTTYHNILCLGKSVEWLDGKIKKGHKVMVTGRQENQSFEGDDGQKKFYSQVVTDTVTPFLQTNGTSKQNDITSEKDVSDDVPF